MVGHKIIKSELWLYLSRHTCLEHTLEQDSFCIFMKSMKISSKLTLLDASVNQEWTLNFWNKFLEGSGIWVLPSHFFYEYNTG